jgi:hypothetical protein
MALLITDEFKKYFTGLTSTSAIVTAWGTTFVNGSNLFVGEESEAHRDMLTIYPTGGGPPDKDGYRMESSVQIRIKSTSNSTGLKTMQEIINVMNQNVNVCASANGRVYALQSNPMPLDKLEGGKFSIFTSNYNIKHIKL